MPAEHLRFSPEILRRLGEELVPHPDLGILELVRNAYDADATSCTVVLRAAHHTGGEILVEDNGEGMSADEIRSGWLLLGKSSKTSSRFTRAGRRKVGEKGLGRLAALRLGARVQLTTTSAHADEGEPRQSTLEIDWGRFDVAEAVDDVPLSVTRQSSDLPSGTIIRIQDLVRPLSSADVRRLARSMVLLTGPFPAQNTFQAILDAPEFVEMERLVREGYFDEHEYMITAEVDTDGLAKARLVDWTGREVASASHSELSRDGSKYGCPPARFELWVFNLSKASFDIRNSTNSVRLVQAWLKEVGGVHLFQRGLRVHPYGDPGHDWLDMNLRRARSPELRPSTNTSVGRVTVDDDQDQLTPKTDRTGFIETEAFTDLRRFGEDVLDWAADVRTRIREQQRQTERVQSKRAVARASQQVEQTLGQVPEEVRPQVQRAIAQYEAALGKQLRSTEDDLLLYRTLGTVGTVTAVFAHETLRPVATIQQMAGSLQLRVRRAVGESEYARTFASPVERIIASTISLRTFAEWPLRMLSRSKRRRGRVNVVGVAEEVLGTFKPYLDEGGISAELQASSGKLLVAGTHASVEAIIANIVANSAYFLGNGGPSLSRDIRVAIESAGDFLTLTIADSGPGLQKISPDDVWLPGRSTREEGTGLGLTIVRDAVQDMGGTVLAVANGELGGAEFRIVLPRVEESNSLALPGLNDADIGGV